MSRLGIRLTKKGSRIGMSDSLRFKILERDGFTCQYCGAKAPDVKLEVDHIIPIKKGGMTVTSNLVTACERCNGGKSSKSIGENAPVLKEISFEKTPEGKIQQKTTVVFEHFASKLDGRLRIVQNETSKTYLSNIIKKHGLEKTLIATNEALKMVKVENDRWDYKSILNAFKSIRSIADKVVEHEN